MLGVSPAWLCLAVPGELKQSRAAWVRPLLVLFSSLREMVQGASWEGQCSQRFTALTQSMYPIEWFGIFCALACPTCRMGILHFISIIFCAGAPVAPHQSVAEENDCLSQALGLALCSPFPDCHFFSQVSESTPQPCECLSVHELVSCTHPQGL